MKKQFKDILNLKVYDWMTAPFTKTVFEVYVTFHEELCKLKYDGETKNNFVSGEYWWSIYSI